MDVITHLEEGRGASALKLKTASEFNSFWTSTLNKAQVGRERGYGHGNTLREGEGRGGSALKLKASSEFDRFWTSTLNKARVGREGGRVWT